MRCDQAQELITAHIDNELDGAEQSAIDAHLQDCPACRSALAAETRLKKQINEAQRSIVAPDSLRRQIENEFAARRPVAANRFGGGFSSWFKLPSWRPAFALALLVVSIVTFYYRSETPPGVSVAAFETHRQLLSGKRTLVRYDDATRLRQELSRAVGNRFAPIALDLSMKNYVPVSGFIQAVGDRQVLVTVYQGGGPAITCFTFLGTEDDAPKDAERFYDAALKVNFYSFAKDGVNGVMHKEGDVICILVSKMAPADILALLRGKSAHA